MSFILGTPVVSTATIAFNAGYFVLTKGFIPIATCLAITTLSLKKMTSIENLMKKMVHYFDKPADKVILKRYEDLKGGKGCEKEITALKDDLGFYFNSAKAITLVGSLAIGYFASALLLFCANAAMTFSANQLASHMDLSLLFSAVAYVGGIPLVPTFVFAVKTVALAALLYQCHQSISKQYDF